MGIEPTALAWEARVLPLYDAREGRHSSREVCSQPSASQSIKLIRAFSIVTRSEK